ncbi:MAG TPA: DUF1295 domain-containing protein, partial [Arthrobacter sp.]|nr:DUF1295 domain-containing protein [Arthrobacter sp.]
MSPFPWTEFAASLLWAALAVALVLAVTFAVAVRQGRHSVMDVAWGPGFVAVSAVSWFLSAGSGDDLRRLLLLVLTAVWGLRLGAHIGWRARDGHEDPRYTAMLGAAPGSRNVYAL